MRPNLASSCLLEQPVSSDCGVRLLARVHQRVTWVDLSTPSISSQLCVAIAAAATSWDDPGNPPGDGCAPPLAPGSCDPPGCVPLVAPGSCEPPGCVPAPSCVHVGGAPPSYDPPSSSCGGKPCKKSKSKSKSSNPNPDPPAWSSRVESGVLPLPT
jgi:hypothetical protein